MSTQDNGGPAFPRDHANDGHNGMTLHDFFAAEADIPWEVASDVVYRQNGNQNGTPLQIMEKRAEMRFQQADAMLRARQS